MIRTINPYSKNIKIERANLVKNTNAYLFLKKYKDIEELEILYKGIDINNPDEEEVKRFNDICNDLNKQGIHDRDIDNYLKREELK